MPLDMINILKQVNMFRELVRDSGAMYKSARSLRASFELNRWSVGFHFKQLIYVSSSQKQNWNV